MKKRVLALMLACTITLTNGNIAFAAEENSENTTDTMVMEEEDTEAETQEDVAEPDTTENETADATNTDMEDKPEENVNTTSVNTNSIAVETSEDVPEQGAAIGGTYGENIKWTYAAGTLRFSGSGDMNNISNGNGGERAPWYNSDYRDSITDIVIEEGITSVGSWAFISLKNVTTVTIPSTVTVIQPHAFQNCQSIKCMNLPNGLTAIGTNAFLFLDSCEGFYIDHPQTAYRTKDGVLFNDTTLLCYPQSKADVSYVIPYGTQIVESWSFTNPKYLTSVYIPETVVKTGGDSFANQHNKMVNPLTVVFNTTGKCQVDVGTFSHLPTRSKAMVKTQELYNQLVNETLKDNGTEGYVNTTTAEFYQQNNYDNYNAMENMYNDVQKKENMYNDVQKKVKSNEITLFGVHQDAATDCVTWKSSDPSVAAIVVPEAYMGNDIKDHIRYNEAETSSSGGYIKGGTKLGTATITVTREDKKKSFNFTVENVVPTTSTEIYHQADGKQQVLGNSLCIHTGKSDTVSLQTVPELTTALAGTVKWTSSDDSKVVVEPSGAYNEKATLYRKAAGDVTVTATMKDENENAIQKSFQVIGDKSTEDWTVVVNNGELSMWVKDSTPLTPNVTIKNGNGILLKEGTDYKVTYENNYLEDGMNAQTAYIFITPIGDYNGNPVLKRGFYIDRISEPQSDPKISYDPKDKVNPPTKKPGNADMKTQEITNVSSVYKRSVGQSFTLKPKAEGEITYQTSNQKVATVNSKGKVTVKGTGKATITVTAKATSTYSNCVKKITVYGVPKKPEMKKLTAGKKRFTVQWKKDKKADGYQVQYSTDKKFKKNVKSVNVSKKNTKATVKKLKKGKTYRVRVRSYKKINGKKYYSGWGKVKSVKVR